MGKAESRSGEGGADPLSMCKRDGHWWNETHDAGQWGVICTDCGAKSVDKADFKVMGQQVALTERRDRERYKAHCEQAGRMDEWWQFVRADRIARHLLRVAKQRWAAA